MKLYVSSNNTAIHLLHIDKNNTTSYETYHISPSLLSSTATELQHINNDLISKYEFNENDFICTAELAEHSYSFESFQYAIISHSKQPSTLHTTANTSLIYDYFMHLSSLQNTALSQLVLQKQFPNTNTIYDVFPLQNCLKEPCLFFIYLFSFCYITFDCSDCNTCSLFCPKY